MDGDSLQTDKQKKENKHAGPKYARLLIWANFVNKNRFEPTLSREDQIEFVRHQHLCRVDHSWAQIVTVSQQWQQEVTNADLWTRRQTVEHWVELQ